ncbi:hypothetical protein CN545_30015 [Bacillus toyonensis]|nr:hypothetical protein CN545_30015 [Bacillus toyonensis]
MIKSSLYYWGRLYTSQLQKGIEEGKMQLIRGMHKNGIPIEDIARFTNLRIEEIQEILQS